MLGQQSELQLMPLFTQAGSEIVRIQVSYIWAGDDTEIREHLVIT
jgi:hypothetical protein